MWVRRLAIVSSAWKHTTKVDKQPDHLAKGHVGVLACRSLVCPNWGRKFENCSKIPAKRLDRCTADHCPQLHSPYGRSQRHPRSSAIRSPLAQTVFVVTEPHAMTSTAGSRFENAFRRVLDLRCSWKERSKILVALLNLIFDARTRRRQVFVKL